MHTADRHAYRQQTRPRAEGRQLQSDMMTCSRAWLADACSWTTPGPGVQARQGGTWKALTRRSVSSTERPTGRSLMVIWRSTPVGEMMNRPLRTRTCFSTMCPHC